MDVEEMKNRIRRFHEEAWNKGNLAAFDEMFAPNCISTNDTTGDHFSAEQLRQGIVQMREADPDGHIDILDIFVEGDRAAFLWRSKGASEQGKVEFVGVSVWRFADGKVVEDHSVSAPVTVGQPTA